MSRFVLLQNHVVVVESWPKRRRAGRQDWWLHVRHPAIVAAGSVAYLARCLEAPDTIVTDIGWLGLVGRHATVILAVRSNAVKQVFRSNRAVLERTATIWVGSKPRVESQ